MTKVWKTTHRTDGSISYECGGGNPLKYIVSQPPQQDYVDINLHVFNVDAWEDVFQTHICLRGWRRNWLTLAPDDEQLESAVYSHLGLVSTVVREESKLLRFGHHQKLNSIKPSIRAGSLLMDADLEISFTQDLIDHFGLSIPSHQGLSIQSPLTPVPSIRSLEETLLTPRV